ncbi:MAG: acetyl-CoA carboxylase biotin carboxylase subunit [Saprospiraceae bacterium]|nr:acetyl-CoA carboxylase biotin carboxylase subunit [Candidatus Brachybacter algidus]
MQKILIANRGEIAVRIIKSCKKIGVKTVAIYSDADANALHVHTADEAYHIGSNALNESYLNAEKIIEIAIKSNSDGIHPGYGFMSENAEFASMVNDAGIIFIGPSPEAITTMGNKLAAKEAVKAFNIPMVPGSQGVLNNKEEARKAAQKVGYPVLIKAAAGGGGKGMRAVDVDENFDESYDRAVSEAISAFKDGAVMIEKYLVKPRHIEIQVIADNHGNVCHLFERECSIQRRHQKVIEEAPSAILTTQMRSEMGAAAVNAARACNYSGVGTVEFLVDADMNFYFLEMNTRLQVEHPVTEMITGLDLVVEQIKIARGEELSFTQEDLKIHGHAMELRVYAEDAYNSFLPSVGTLMEYKEPEGIGIRVDSGYVEGDDIPVFYDPLISKLVVWAEDRAMCVEKMKAAISDYNIRGLETNLLFSHFVMNHVAFVSGDFDTGFVSKYFTKEDQDDQERELGRIASMIASKLNEDAQDYNVYSKSMPSNWRNNAI